VKILIDIIHPAHVHFFRNAIGQLQRRGQHVAVSARKKDVTTELLDCYGIAYNVLSEVGRGRAALGKELIARDWRLWRFCRRFKPDVLTGISGIFAAHVGFLLGKPSVVWDDTEHQKQVHRITYPVATNYQSPDCYRKCLGKKQHFYAGFHELAYLRPRWFTPNAELVRSLGIDPHEKYCIIRLVSWGAHHDVGQHGLEDAQKVAFMQELAQHARPYISSEGPLPAELERYRLNIPVHQIHHVLAFAALCIAEGATVASEACVLAVPAVYVNTLRLGYIDMLETYGLLKQATDTDHALRLALRLLEDPETPQNCRRGREHLLADKIDVTDYIVQTIEHAGQPLTQRRKTSS